MRLYDCVWVLIEGSDEPVQALKNLRNLALFDVAGFQYDIDGRPVRGSEAAPRITKLLSLSESREHGLSLGYNRDLRTDAGAEVRLPR